MKKRPNILFMIADDHRYSAIHGNGDDRVQTPILDQLANEGVSFQNTHIMGGMTGAICVPSRACLHTGTNVFRSSMDRVLPSEIDIDPGLMSMNPTLKLLPEVFKEAGYHTHGVGKWHNDKVSFTKSFKSGGKIFFGGMCSHENVPVYDFEHEGVYPPEQAYKGESFSTELFCDEAKRFINDYDKEDDPFFLYVAFTSPHDPRTAPPQFQQMYDPDQISLPKNFMEQHPFDNGELSIRDEKLAPFPRTADNIRQQIADYYAMITHMDYEIGKVLETLQERGLAEDTIIVYMSDHGLSVGQHGLLGKQNVYDHSIRVPMIIKGPGIPMGQRIEALTYGYDIYPTLCELTGTAVPETVEAQSLNSLIKGEKQAIRTTVYTAYKDMQRMVKDERWKLIRYYTSDAQHTGTDKLQLFDLDNDPFETNDLSDDPNTRSHIERLAEAMSVWQHNVNDPMKHKPILMPAIHES